mmetsp:Transcript_3715/g.9007  ORF Transcript_3715/g.9007 Transcript_3715/m.9007 type:complete len:211 (+) Transcript_3715:1512-2144(+)
MEGVLVFVDIHPLLKRVVHRLLGTPFSRTAFFAAAPALSGAAGSRRRRLQSLLRSPLSCHARGARAANLCAAASTCPSHSFLVVALPRGRLPSPLLLALAVAGRSCCPPLMLLGTPMPISSSLKDALSPHPPAASESGLPYRHGRRRSGESRSPAGRAQQLCLPDLPAAGPRRCRLLPPPPPPFRCLPLPRGPRLHPPTGSPLFSSLLWF